MNKIDSFNEKYRFLSNFYIHEVIEYQGLKACSVEAAYQGMKTLDFEMKSIIFLSSPSAAKAMGRRVKIRDDWEHIKLLVMEDLVRLKFSIPDLRKRLISTGNAELIEGNWWGDIYWGVCRGKGENHLGKILMKIRGEL